MKKYYNNLAKGYRKVAEGFNQEGFREAKRGNLREARYYSKIAKSLGWLGDGKFAYSEFMRFRDGHTNYVTSRKSALSSALSAQNDADVNLLEKSELGTKYLEPRVKNARRYDKFAGMVADSKKILGYSPLPDDFGQLQTI